MVVKCRRGRVFCDLIKPQKSSDWSAYWGCEFHSVSPVSFFFLIMSIKSTLTSTPIPPFGETGSLEEPGVRGMPLPQLEYGKLFALESVPWLWRRLYEYFIVIILSLSVRAIRGPFSGPHHDNLLGM